MDDAQSGDVMTGAGGRAPGGGWEDGGMSQFGDLFDKVYEAMEGSTESLAYSERHGIAAQAVLTVHDDETSWIDRRTHLAPRIEGKTIIEIGGGIGPTCACHLGHIAKRVYCIEEEPDKMVSWTFAAVLLKQKPKNVSFLFGAADEFLGCVKGDVALYCTHSDVNGMGLVAAQFAPLVIDVYGEIIKGNPRAFDEFARTMREVV